MCVASYGVMPQTYMRDVGPVAESTSPPEAASHSRTGPCGVPGSVGRGVAGQRVTLADYRRSGDGAPVRQRLLPEHAPATAGSEGRPGDGGAAPPRAGGGGGGGGAGGRGA